MSTVDLTLVRTRSDRARRTSAAPTRTSTYEVEREKAAAQNALTEKPIFWTKKVAWCCKSHIKRSKEKLSGKLSFSRRKLAGPSTYSRSERPFRERRKLRSRFTSKSPYSAPIRSSAQTSHTLVASRQSFFQADLPEESTALRPLLARPVTPPTIQLRQRRSQHHTRAHEIAPRYSFQSYDTFRHVPAQDENQRSGSLVSNPELGSPYSPTRLFRSTSNHRVEDITSRLSPEETADLVAQITARLQRAVAARSSSSLSSSSSSTETLIRGNSAGPAPGRSSPALASSVRSSASSNSTISSLPAIDPFLYQHHRLRRMPRRLSLSERRPSISAQGGQGPRNGDGAVDLDRATPLGSDSGTLDGEDGCM